MEFIDEAEMNEYINKMKYLLFIQILVVNYINLSVHSKEICVDSSTISKRMSNGENMVKARVVNIIFT